MPRPATLPPPAVEHIPPSQIPPHFDKTLSVTDTSYASLITTDTLWVTSGDVDNDSDLDLVYSESGGNFTSNNNVAVLLNNGDGTFVLGSNNFVAYPETNILGDFNSDGNLDIAATNTFSSQVGVLLGNGDGTFDPQVTYQVGNVVTGVATYDLNEDGHLDLVTSSYYDGQISIFLGNGDGTFQNRSTIDVGGTTMSAVTAVDLGKEVTVTVTCLSSRPMLIRYRS